MSEQNNSTPATRGYYNELESYPTWVSEIIKDLEGRAFTTGIEFNRKQGFEAVNYSVYGFAIVEGQQLAILQLRRSYRRRAGYFMSVRKDYYLVGRNENGNTFAHPIENVCVRGKALDNIEGAVLKALALIWGVKVDEIGLIVRNGDMAFVPVTARSIPADAIEILGVTLEGSHTLTPGTRGQVLYSRSLNAHFAKRAAKLSHDKGQHPTAAIVSGIYRVVAGARAAHWGFTRPTAD